jgi:hypothetical protein
MIRPFAAIALWVLAAPPAAAGPPEDEAIKATALDYIEGWYLGDAQRVEQALHPQLVRRRVTVDVATGEPQVQDLDAAAMVRAASQGVGRAALRGPLDVTVTILDQYQDLADVRVVSPLYVDYLHLVKWEGRWVILSALWGPVAAPGE